MLLWHWQLWHCRSPCQSHRYNTSTLVAPAHVISVAAVGVTLVAVPEFSMSWQWYWLLLTVSVSLLWHRYFMSVNWILSVAIVTQPRDAGRNVSSVAAITLTFLRVLLTRILLLTLLVSPPLHWKIGQCCSHYHCRRYDIDTVEAAICVVSIAVAILTRSAVAVFSMLLLWRGRAPDAKCDICTAFSAVGFTSILLKLLWTLLVFFQALL